MLSSQHTVPNSMRHARRSAPRCRACQRYSPSKPYTSISKMRIAAATPPGMMSSFKHDRSCSADNHHRARIGTRFVPEPGLSLVAHSFVNDADLMFLLMDVLTHEDTHSASKSSCSVASRCSLPASSHRFLLPAMPRRLSCPGETGLRDHHGDANALQFLHALFVHPRGGILYEDKTKYTTVHSRQPITYGERRSSSQRPSGRRR
jgi:hypothetical protein